VNEIFISDVLDKEKLSKEEIIFLLKLSEKEDLDKLFHKADEVRKKFIGEEVFVRGILEF
jgi:biotin synthase